MMRAWAVWERNRIVAALLVFLFLVSTLIWSPSTYENIDYHNHPSV